MFCTGTTCTEVALGLDAGSGFGVGLVRGVLLMFELSLVLVDWTVPGIGRSSLFVAQLHSEPSATRARSGREKFAFMIY